MENAERNTISQQLSSLNDTDLRMRTNSLRDMIETGKVPAAKIDGAREMLTMAWAERNRRGV